MPQRMRYGWIHDRPRNVSRQDYDRYQLILFGAIGLGLFTFMLLFAAISGLTLRHSQKLAEIDDMTVEEAVAYDGASRELVKIEGFLMAETPIVMPDDEARQVVQGQLKIIAKNPGNRPEEDESSEGENAEDAPVSDAGDSAAIPPETVLLEWEETAETVFLSDGDRQIPLTFDLAVLPLSAEQGSVEPEFIREGDSARTRRPVAVQYGDEVLPLPEAYLEQRNSVPVEVERFVLPQGASAVVVAGLEATSDGNQLIDPLGDRLQVNLGTEAEIQGQGQRLRVMFFILAIPAGVASWFLGRSAMAMRREFVRISNE